jgi:hypothetical protein
MAKKKAKKESKGVYMCVECGLESKRAGKHHGKMMKKR